MPRSFLVKKKRQADMVNRETVRVDTGTTPSRRIYSEGTPADKSHDNTDVSTEIKSRDTTNHQINPNMENGFKLDSSVGLETSFSVVFSQSHGKLYDGTEQAFRFLSAPQRDACELNKGKLATWSFGAHSKREPLALPVVIKQEVVGDDEDGSAFMMEENGWEEKFTKKSSFESLDMPPSLFGHSSIAGQAAGNQHHLALKTENEDFEISEFLQLDEGEIMERSEEMAQDYARCSSPSSMASEDSFPGSIGNSADFSGSFGNSEDASRASTSQRKDAKAKNVSNKKYRYTCDVCGKSFSRSNTLTTHKRIHTGDKPFICEQCGRAFRQPGNLTRHRLTHTTVKPYVCPQCNKAFNRASNLHTHMRTHTNYKPFVCDFCGKGFHQKIDMKIHRYTHTGEKPHKCDKCGRGFKQLTHLTYHLRTHSEMRMYQCEHCGKGFNQKGNLQAHIYGHTGERPFKCQTCGKGFTLASTLNTHKRTHASKKPFECQFCSKAFYQKNALKTHYIASHPYANGVSLL